LGFATDIFASTFLPDPFAVTQGGERNKWQKYGGKK